MMISIEKIKKLKIIGALLVSYDLILVENEFVIITDTVNSELRSEYREFVKLKFSEVTNFKKTKGLYKPLGYVDRNFSCSETEFHVILQDISIEQVTEHRHSLSLWFGESFGGIEMDFVSCEMQNRVGQGEEISKGHWIYTDETTGELINFYHPFG